ncbi:MAG: PLP-dependent aminotransferase family protein [Anaerolineae bacterium]|nr:PLP-dependent aminotransferase family protein [Anaerolineae bacterium]
MARSAHVTAHLRLNKHSAEPLYRQLARALRERIAEGVLCVGDKLPPSRQLAAQLGVSRMCVVNAYTELLNEGILMASPGRGTFVAESFGALSDPSALPSVAANPSAGTLSPESVIAFSGGAPAEEFLPVAAIRRSIEAVLERDGATAVAYEETEGYPPLRAAVAQHLASLGIRATPENVLITGGCQQALDLAIQALLNEGDTLLTTSPTYLGILDIARIRRLRVVGVPTDEQGLRTELLESAIIACRPRLIYIAPTHHNPTGSVMPLHRRRVLLRIAAVADIPVLEDGVYHELSYGAEPPPPLKALDEYGVVIHANGFSKIVLPGVRIGYLVVEGALRQRVLRVKQAADICTPSLNQRAMHHFLVSGALSGHLDRVRRACQQRRDVALKAAQRYLPSGARWSVPSGGVYLWIELPHSGVTAAQLYPVALRHGVSFAIGAEFFTDESEPSAAYFIRLNFAQQSASRIEEGMRRLGAAWSEACAVLR